MKLTHCLLICSLLMCCNAFAQQNTTNDSNSFNEMDSPSKALEEGEMNILFSYYDQDGEHSPVTGGIGTEALQDYTSTIIVNLPLNEKSRLNVMTGFDFYSSASTDNIDTRVSSASSSDSRVYFNVGYTRLVPDKNKSFGVSLGASHEYDVNSVQVGLNFSKASKDNNRELSLAAQAYFDSWSLIYPSELRRQGALLNTNL
ncbi:MAG: hypothetical protein AB8B69_13815, partial [Chitinophagales bacterium]